MSLLRKEQQYKRHTYGENWTEIRIGWRKTRKDFNRKMITKRLTGAYSDCCCQQKLHLKNCDDCVEWVLDVNIFIFITLFSILF